MNLVEELVIIGIWVKSCKNIGQLNNVETFLERKIKILDSKFNIYSKRELIILSINIGIVYGNIMTTKCYLNITDI